MVGTVARNSFPHDDKITARMHAVGIRSQTELATLAGVYPTEMCRMINRRKSVVNRYGSWRPAVLRVAKVLSCRPEDLFSYEHLSLGAYNDEDEEPVSEEAVRRALGEPPSADPEQLVWPKLEAERVLAFVSEPAEREYMQGRLQGLNKKEAAEEAGLAGNLQDLEKRCITRIRRGLAREDKLAHLEFAERLDTSKLWEESEREAAERREQARNSYASSEFWARLEEKRKRAEEEARLKELRQREELREALSRADAELRSEEAEYRRREQQNLNAAELWQAGVRPAS